MSYFLVEHKGFEPLTSSMPWKRASQLRQCPPSEPTCRPPYFHLLNATKVLSASGRLLLFKFANGDIDPRFANLGKNKEQS